MLTTAKLLQHTSQTTNTHTHKHTSVVVVGAVGTLSTKQILADLRHHKEEDSFLANPASLVDTTRGRLLGRSGKSCEQGECGITVAADGA